MGRWGVVIVMLAFGVLYVVYGVPFRAEREEPTLRVVRTFGELRATEAHQLTPVDRLWVGIGDHEITEDEATLVYLWFQRSEPPPPDSRPAARVAVEVNGVERHTLNTIGSTLPTERFQTLLIHPGASDALRVEIVDVGQGPLADAIVRVTPGDDRFWRPLRQPDAYTATDNTRAEVELEQTGGPAAVPFARMFDLIRGQERDAYPDDRPLPRLLPEASTLSLLPTARGFVLRLPRPVAPSQPRDLLLASFDVTPGSATDPPAVADLPFILDAGLEWNFDDLGLQSGDRVSLELMWCPTGWTTDGELRPERTVGWRDGPQRSNRIVVTVP